MTDPLINISNILEDARAHLRKGAPQEALITLDTARIKKNHPLLLIEMANILSSIKNDVGAQTILESGLSDFPLDTRMVIAYANYCYTTSQFEKALAVTSPLAEQKDCSSDLRLSHAHLLKASGKKQEAALFYQSVLQYDAKNIIALSSLGSIAMDERDYDVAIDYFKKAVCIEKDNAHLHTQLAYAYFRNGELANGWQHYHARFGYNKHDGIVQPRPFTAPLWDGTPLSHGKLLIWGEQAVGEEIIYLSMLEDAKRLCPNGAIVECDPRLVSLFGKSFPDVEFIARGNPPDPKLLDASVFAQCPAGNLGEFFRRDFDTFPSPLSYLRAEQQKVAALQKYYREIAVKLGKSGKIIGISWKSKALRHGDPKSTAFEAWAPIFENSPHLFVSLQRGDITDELKIAQQNNWAVIEDKNIDQNLSLDDFAAQICSMDEIVTVSNSTAHMAGACGIKTHVLLPASVGLMWHWFDKSKNPSRQARDISIQSPWYGSVTLIRQQQDGIWDDVLQRAKMVIG